MSFIENIAMLFMAIFGFLVSIIGVCIFIMVLSLTLNCVTGIDLIGTYIKPAFSRFK